MSRPRRPVSAKGMFRAALLGGLLLSLVPLPPSHAQSTRGGGGSREQEALAKAQFLMRQLSAEKAELQARNAQLDGEIEGLKGEVEGLESKLERTRQTLERYKETDGQLRDLLRKSQERTRDLIEKYNAKLEEAATLIRQLQTDKAELETVSAERQQAIKLCEQKNAELYEANVDLLERYNDKDFWDALKQQEPFTGLGAVEIENLVEDYRYKLEDLRFDRERLKTSRQ